jgi:cutinase
MMHNVVPALPADIKTSTVAGVLFGDTKNKQSGASIDKWPASKLITFCNSDDGVCGGGLNVNSGHLAYMLSGDLDKAATFLADKIKGTG